MGIGYRIKEAREIQGLTQIELGRLVGVTGSAIKNYENEKSHPKEPGMYKLIEALKVDANYLFQDCVNLPKEVNDITLAEYDRIKKYRALDNPGREHVDTILQWESDRVKQLGQVTPAAIVELHKAASANGRLIEYFRSVSAGTGQVIFDDVYSERITMPDIPEYRRVAYAVKVDGRSMEPLYNDGDILLIEPTCEIAIGEIGIFNVNGLAYVKQLGQDRLISLNKGYDDIPLTEDSVCMGRVVDKL